MPKYQAVSGSAAEDLFIDLFSESFGAEKAGYLYSQYPFFDICQNSMIYLGWDVYHWAVCQMQIQPEAVKDDCQRDILHLGKGERVRSAIYLAHRNGVLLVICTLPVVVSCNCRAPEDLRIPDGPVRIIERIGHECTCLFRRLKLRIFHKLIDSVHEILIEEHESCRVI